MEILKTTSEPFLSPEQEKRLPARHLEVGKLGEDLACRLLWRRGYRVLARNFRGKRGEVDIIGERRGRIHFFEVKTRTSDSLGSPEERVDADKQKALQQTAEEYLSRFRDQAPAGSQFDVVALVIDPSKRAILEQNILEDAF